MPADAPAAPPSGQPAQGGTAPSTQKAPELPKPLTIKGTTFKSEDDAFAEIERGRQSSKLLTEAQKRLMEASKKEKAFQELRESVKTKRDAQRLIKELDLSDDEAEEVFGRWLYEKRVLPKELDPKERRIRELEAAAKARQEEDSAKEAAAREAEMSELTKKEEARLKDELTRLLESKKVPSTRLALRRMANYLAAYAEAGADIPAERAADLVMADYKQEFSELIGEASIDQLSEFFGEKQLRAFARKVSEWVLARKREGANIKPPDTTIMRKSVEQANQDKKERLSPQDFMRIQRGLK